MIPMIISHRVHGVCLITFLAHLANSKVCQPLRPQRVSNQVLASFFARLMDFDTLLFFVGVEL